MRVSFTSRKTTICCICPPIGSQKLSPLLYYSEVTSEILYGTSNGTILDIDVVSVDLNKTILKFDDFLKHDISELTACSRVVDPAFLKFT